MMKCVKCFQELPEGAKFCFNCGAAVEVKTVATGSEAKAEVSALKNQNLPSMISVQGSQYMPSVDRPKCIITLSSFKISQAPVTQKQYIAIMDANPSKLKGLDFPVECVNWCEAIIYCNRLSVVHNLQPCYSIGTTTDLASFDFSSPVWKRITCNFTANGFRLPTETEWEFAARGGVMQDHFKYAGSDDINEVAWYGENSNITTHTIGTKKPNGLGLYDMCGNVAEWCWDYFTNELPSGAVTNPHGPNVGTLHVKRGGSWLDDEQQCTIAYRSASAINGKSSNLGFRVCQTII